MMRKQGFTLIELLITITLIGSILIVITSIYLVGFRTYTEQLATSTVQSDAQTILDAVILDAKNGLLIEETFTNPGNGTVYTTGPNSIIIQVPAIDAGKNIQYNGTDELFDRIIYYYKDESIHKIVFADSRSVRFPKNGKDTTLDTKILALSFEYDPPDPGAAHLVKVIMKSDIKVGNRNKEITLTGEARLRNHI